MKTIEGLAVTFTANGKRQIQVENFSKILRKEGDKTVENNSHAYNWRETTYFCNKQLTTIKGKTWSRAWYKFKFTVWRKCES